jgi:hypothetical protein
MQHISSSSLENLPARISYLSSFLELAASDGEALLAAKPLVAPLVPAILDAVYKKLLSFDITAQAFVPRNTGYEGQVVKSVQELTIEHPQIALRKDFLKVGCSFPLHFLYVEGISWDGREGVGSDSLLELPGEIGVDE